jgi:hypothetical protein
MPVAAPIPAATAMVAARGMFILTAKAGLAYAMVTGSNAIKLLRRSYLFRLNFLDYCHVRGRLI